MRYTRVIVDGFSVLHRDPQLKPLLATQPALARHQLVRRAEEIGLGLADAVTVVFDGRRGLNDAFVGFRAEVVFSPPHLSADGFIERMVRRAPRPEQLLVVTSDRIERELVSAAGADTLAAGDFLAQGQRARREPVRAPKSGGPARLGRVGDAFPPAK